MHFCIFLGEVAFFIMKLAYNDSWVELRKIQLLLINYTGNTYSSASNTFVCLF